MASVRCVRVFWYIGNIILLLVVVALGLMVFHGSPLKEGPPGSGSSVRKQDAEAVRAISELLESRFDERERMRVRALNDNL